MRRGAGLFFTAFVIGICAIIFFASRIDRRMDSLQRTKSNTNPIALVLTLALTLALSPNPYA